MKLWLIVLRSDDQTWVEDTWDDETTAENNQGWEDAVQQARQLATEGQYEMRILDVDVPGIHEAFEQAPLTGAGRSRTCPFQPGSGAGRRTVSGPGGGSVSGLEPSGPSESKVHEIRSRALSRLAALVEEVAEEMKEYVEPPYLSTDVPIILGEIGKWADRLGEGPPVTGVDMRLEVEAASERMKDWPDYMKVDHPSPGGDEVEAVAREMRDLSARQYVVSPSLSDRLNELANRLSPPQTTEEERHA